MTELPIQDALLLHVRSKYGTQQVACQKLGINKATLSAALKGKRPIPPALLADAGYVARVVYERVPKENAQ